MAGPSRILVIVIVLAIGQTSGRPTLVDAATLAETVALAAMLSVPAGGEKPGT